MVQTERAEMRFLGDYLFSESPGELLIVGHLPEVLLEGAVNTVTVRRLARLCDAEALAATSPLEDQQTPRTLVLALDVGGHEGEVSLGRAVRSFPHRVFVHCGATQAGPAPSDETFFALGFRKLTLMEDMGNDNSEVRWFEYRLSEYKIAPDWLNARFWANPDRFDHLDDPYDSGEDDDEEEEE